MHCQGGSTGLLADLRKLHGVHMVLIPALAELHRHRAVHGGHHRPNDLPCQLRALHQGAAAAASGNLGGRAAHIDVDPVRVPGQRLFCGCRHQLRVVPEELDGAGALGFAQVEQFLALAVAVNQPLGTGHLPDGADRSVPAADLPECPVAHPGHGGQCSRPGQCDVPDLQVSVSPLRQDRQGPSCFFFLMRQKVQICRCLCYNNLIRIACFSCNAPPGYPGIATPEAVLPCSVFICPPLPKPAGVQVIIPLRERILQV